MQIPEVPGNLVALFVTLSAYCSENFHHGINVPSLVWRIPKKQLKLYWAQNCDHVVK